MTLHVNETVRNLADSVRRYATDTAARYRAKDESTNTTKAFTARKTAALGAGASLLLSGMVYGVAEAAPRSLERHQLAPLPVAVAQAQDAPAAAAEAASAPAPAVADPAAVDGAGPAEPAPAGPVTPVEDVYVTSPFGWRINPMTGSGLEWHTGTDFRGATGTHVRSTLGGTVTEAGWHTNGGGGLRIVVDHGDGTKSTYNHLNEIWVEPGQWVDGGQVIGSVGSTGNSTGPHLHFEVLVHDEYVDPMEWLGQS